MKVIEYDVLIATRRQRMLDMLEGRIKMPLELDMRAWKCGTVGCAIGNYCLLPETEGLWLGEHYIPTDGNSMGLRAIDQHFGLPRYSAMECFSDANPNDPVLIASKFRAAINHS